MPTPLDPGTPEEDFAVETLLMHDPFDVEHQNNLYLIETALQDLGVLPQPQRKRPDYFDTQLMQLINAVPLE